RCRSLPPLRLAGGPEFPPGPFRPRTSAKGLERVACRAQRPSCCGDPASMAQPRAVFEEQPDPMERPAGQVGGQRGSEVALGRVVVGEQGPGVEKPDLKPGRRGLPTEAL